MNEEEFYEFLEQINERGEHVLHIFEIDNQFSLCTQEESFKGELIDRSKAELSFFLKKFEEENIKEEIEPPYVLEEMGYFSYLLRFEKEKKVCSTCVARLYEKDLVLED